jgi:protein-arginine kinase activator protein McsA
MRCDFCGHREAAIVVYLAQGETEAQNKLFLCRRCATHISVVRLFEQGLKRGPIRSERSLNRHKTKRCPFCLLPLSSFLESGRLGCPYCYSAFSREIEKWTKDGQAGRVHRGSAPWRFLQKKKIRESLSQALQDFERCVAEENYERAGRLKKLIERLQSLL